MKIKETVLIVEDNPDHMQIASKILTYANYMVLEASDGESGLKIAQSESPQVILLDLSLPRMDGFQVLKKLKSMEKTKDIKVIVLTAHDEEENRDLAEELGCDGFLKKPFTPYFAEVEFKRVLKKRDPL
jgi:two-component system cell cycle response regulator DivK